MFDYKKARNNMVDNLIRPSNVTNPELLNALRSVQRDKFLPSNLAGLSYSETELVIQNDRTSINPWLLAKMIQSLNLNSTDNVLSLATGFGYSCALLSSLANFVVAVESCDLAPEAQSRLIENGYDNILVKEGNINEGAKNEGPYDVILIEGAVEFVNEEILDQLKWGGRILAVFKEKNLGQCRLGVKADSQVQWANLFEANCTLLNEFRNENEFTL
ncbi:MAG: protein-L-isoaspartate O-methyltransferase family protein [Paracoccaceae bacterium]